MPHINPRPIAIILGSLLVAATLAACGSSDDEQTDSTAAAAPSTGGSTEDTSKPAKHAPVEVSDAAGIGEILVDADDRTLYLFEADTDNTSTCMDACAQAWPPYLTDGDPTAGDGADASLLGTTSRDAGGVQVSYDGHPLYYFAGDSGPGEANGNDIEQFGAEWYALTASGQNAEEGEGEDESGSDDSEAGESTEGGSSGYSTP